MAGQGKSRFNIKDAALEITGIVFAVLLALWLESWRDDMELQQRADVALSRIQLEVETNRREVRASIAENNANIAAITAALKNNTGADENRPPLIDRIGPHLAISSSSLSDSAWTSAKMTEVLGRMPADHVARLAGVYDTQSYYRDYARFFMREYTNLTIDIQYDEVSDKAARKFVQHLALLNSIGDQLLAAYDGYLSPSPGTDVD
ncbi:MULTISPECIES: hypothetical protein [Kordiimonas]|jgi:hypothetical protein|uniref:Uncharacterized protein n=1 Tax=Kordiimonas lacus TaxID=637679 RepID=A0A1G6TZE3_9PROT|nr:MULTISPECIES: hypothetical protein [Kordiimonas]SDD34304.1 hypothetical protein SAMN04488071_0413 [Kordiimonas lacus]